MGMQNKFSWGQVAMSGIVAGLGNAITQGVSVAADLQDKFSWTAVAAAGMGAAVATGMGRLLSGTPLALPGKGMPMTPGSLVGGTMSGVANSMAQASLTGFNRLNWGAVAASSFGSALGDQLTNSMVAADGQGLNKQVAQGRALAYEMAGNGGRIDFMQASAASMAGSIMLADNSAYAGVMSDAFQGYGSQSAYEESRPQPLTVNNDVGGEAELDTIVVMGRRPGAYDPSSVENLYQPWTDQAFFQQLYGQLVNGMTTSDRWSDRALYFTGAVLAGIPAGFETLVTGLYDVPNYSSRSGQHFNNAIEQRSWMAALYGTGNALGMGVSMLPAASGFNMLKGSVASAPKVLTAVESSEVASLSHKAAASGFENAAVKTVSPTAEQSIVANRVGGRIDGTKGGVLDLTIASNSATGNPAVIARGFGTLNTRQTTVLAQMDGYGTQVIVSKNFSNRDLSALTAATGDEFAMFTTGGRRLIIRGDATSVPINSTTAQGLSGKGWRWSSHTHPDGSLMSSPGDRAILDVMDGKRSAIFNPYGERGIFTPYGDSLQGWRPR